MEPTDYIRFLMALLFVLALMGGLYIILKRLSAGGTIGTLTASTKRRLKISEILYLDSRHKAVLIKRDNDTEHLVILGPSGETVVESNITPPPQNNETSA
jgi:flagellar protein FliO/FliZ